MRIRNPEMRINPGKAKKRMRKTMMNKRRKKINSAVTRVYSRIS
jgi:hypothetical protein